MNKLSRSSKHSRSAESIFHYSSLSFFTIKLHCLIVMASSDFFPLTRLVNVILQCLDLRVVLLGSLFDAGLDSSSDE